MDDNMAADIAELHKKIHDLRQRNLIYQKAVEVLADGFLIVGRDGTVLEINKAYCAYFGIQRDKALGQPIQSIIKNTKMIEIMDKRLTEIDAIHEFPAGQTASGERLVAVSRMPVEDNGKVIASAALIKFSRYTLELARTLREMGEEVEFYKEELRRHGIDRFAFADLPTLAPTYLEAKKLAERFARSDLPILLLGETGVGKDVFANAIHQASVRRNGPFICVNCASIPAELLESELFGYAEGAFTGSRRGGQRGKFELADGGTLFLDEIGDMPSFMQSKLLRVLQNNEVEKLGAEKAIPINVRILAATNQDLTSKLEQNTFRADLYYRLNVLPVCIPPLRARVEDIPTLARAFLNELNKQYERRMDIADPALALLQRYTWPGNVRELRNVIGRAFMMAETKHIQPSDLPPHIGCDPNLNEAELPISTVLAQQEREMIINCLHKHRFNCSRVAKALGIHRGTLYDKMEHLNIDIASLRALSMESTSGLAN